jgi:glycosyltransferase involved in cell wall biosynthesis
MSGIERNSEAERPLVSVVIPAYNEETTREEVVSGVSRHVGEVIVVDDGSSDDTADKAVEAGAVLLKNDENVGNRLSLIREYRAAKGEDVVTLDSDGQHHPDDVPHLVGPILKDRADLVIGIRPELPHFSERVITTLTRLKVKVEDASSGFRAIRKSVADEMEIHGSCTCGTFILEAYSRGARVVGVPNEVSERENGRRIQTRHLKQVLFVLYTLLRY